MKKTKVCVKLVKLVEDIKVCVGMARMAKDIKVVWS